MKKVIALLLIVGIILMGTVEGSGKPSIVPASPQAQNSPAEPNVPNPPHPAENNQGKAPLILPPPFTG